MENEVLETKKKNRLVIIILVVVGLLFLLAGGFYFYINSNSLLVIRYNTNKLTNSITEMIEEQEGLKKASGNIAIDYNIEASDASLKEIVDVFNGIKLNYNYKLDIDNKLLHAEVGTTYKNDKLIDVNMYAQDKNAFIQLPGVFDKYIKVDISDDYDEMFNITKNTKESKIVIQSVNKAFLSSLKKEYLVSSDDKVMIDGKEVKVSKITMELDGKKLTTVSKDFLTYLYNDQEFIKAFDTLSDSNDTKNKLKDAIDDVYYNDQDSVVLSIYCKGLLKEIVKYEASLKSDGESYSVFVLKNKNAYDFQVKQANDLVAEGSVVTEFNNNDGKISIKASVKELGKVTFNITIKEDKNVAVEKKNVKNSINSDELTEKQSEEILAKLMENKGFSKLFTVFGTLISQSY